MRRAYVLFFVFLASCASIPPTIDVIWPDPVDFMEATGDVNVAWYKIHFSGSLVLRMEYPRLLYLEVYGPFGQTLVHVKKDENSFLLIAGDEKVTDERVFEDKTGLHLQQFMDDLAMRGERKALSGTTIIERENYRVSYGQDRRGRRTITWEGNGGTMLLILSQVSFARGDAHGSVGGGSL